MSDATRRRVSNVSVDLPEGLRLTVVAGPDKGRSLVLGSRPYAVGQEATCDLVLTDPTVSRRHLAVSVLPDGVEFQDLDSTNGSFCAGVRFHVIRGGVGTAIQIGDTELRVTSPESVAAGKASSGGVQTLGRMVATSGKMLALFEAAQRAATTDAALLILGETGTGKELLAEAIHQASPRRDGPFVICDLAALAPSLAESELFGHVRGAFTGADRARPGAFADADGGTIFLDEIGELELDLQPRLLRALEAHKIKHVGSSEYQAVNVRVVAATNRQLSDEVREGRFRRDLYHRLNVVSLEIPSLRERPEDIPLLVEHFLAEGAAAAGRRPPLVPADTLAILCGYDWPGNVRELRHVIERAILLDPESPVLEARRLGIGTGGGTAGFAEASAPGGPQGKDPLKFKEAKERLVDAWEREYVSTMLQRAGGNISEASRRAGIARMSFHRLLKKHGISS